MAQYISDRGVKIIEELKEYLRKKEADQQFIGLINAVPGSRSFFGYFKYQLFEKENSYERAKKALIKAVNEKIDEMRKEKKGEDYYFYLKDADGVAYLLNDLDPNKKPDIFDRIANMIPESIKGLMKPFLQPFKRLLQPGGVKRYVAVLIIIAMLVITLLGGPLFHLPLWLSAIISTALMISTNIISKIGSTSSDPNNLEIYKCITPTKNKFLETPDTTQKIHDNIGPRKPEQSNGPTNGTSSRQQASPRGLTSTPVSSDNHEDPSSTNSPTHH